MSDARNDLKDDLYGVVFCAAAIPFLILLVAYYLVAVIKDLVCAALWGVVELCDSLQRNSD